MEEPDTSYKPVAMVAWVSGACASVLCHTNTDTVDELSERRTATATDPGRLVHRAGSLAYSLTEVTPYRAVSGTESRMPSIGGLTNSQHLGNNPLSTHTQTHPLVTYITLLDNHLMIMIQHQNGEYVCKCM